MKAGYFLAIVAANKSRDGDETALATSRLLTSPDQIRFGRSSQTAGKADRDRFLVRNF